jgi:hypothetical protein
VCTRRKNPKGLPGKLLENECSSIGDNRDWGLVFKMETVSDKVRSDFDGLHLSLILMEGILDENEPDRRGSVELEGILAEIEEFRISQAVFFFDGFLLDLPGGESFGIQNVRFALIQECLGLERMMDEQESDEDKKESQPQKDPNGSNLPFDARIHRGRC